MMRAANRFDFLYLAKPSLSRVPLITSCTGLRLGHHPKGRMGLLNNHHHHQSFIRTYLATNSKQLEDKENAESNEQVVVETATEHNSSAEATTELSPEEEEMKRGEAYDRWLTMLRQELRNIESQVLLAASSSKPTESRAPPPPKKSTSSELCDNNSISTGWLSVKRSATSPKLISTLYFFCRRRATQCQ